jgi:hypothetical protein
MAQDNGPDFDKGVGSLIFEAEMAEIAPERITANYEDSAPTRTDEQIVNAEAMQAMIDAAWAARTEDTASDGKGPEETWGREFGVPSGETPIAGAFTSAGQDASTLSEDVPNLIDEAQAVSPMADNTFTIFRYTSLYPTTGSSPINEPAHATSGKNVFYTGNWYAARSTNGGASWSYLNPYADFPRFCCDQDIVYEPGRDLFLWYRQGIYTSSIGANEIKLGVSNNGGASFCTYTLRPTNLSSGFTSQWFDYPHLALSNNYLYITTNMFSAGGSFLRMALLRFPLNSLAACAGFSFPYWTQTSGWSWTPVQGATTTMYLGDTASSSGTFRVYTQSEANTTLSLSSRSIPAWTFTNRNGSCPVPSGVNPCARPDQRITAGWVAKNVIGFFWNVKQGAGFPYPYVNAALFSESSKTYLGRPFIWNPSFAFQYGAASPNVRGDLGIGVNALGGSLGYPRFCVGMDDDYNGAPPGWEVSCPVASSNWTASSLGDYNRVRAFQPVGLFWTASGHRGSGSNYRPAYVVFGRGREQRAFNLWQNK